MAEASVEKRKKDKAKKLESPNVFKRLFRSLAQVFLVTIFLLETLKLYHGKSLYKLKKQNRWG
ncbi:hypothetical protein A2917_03765 [Candidatus Nomurabacteria bacterium RIFCSPLOWO2_01_FULL_42_17]|uniref:Uncharacterized protein n=1 Tax=Candidatus Nomurabacteria bacterium RIFCSPLOWO2_01_FULL_42_17 TaxID=1801780 RepID=A0A1F6XN78_9BACT|nr:MAG: hypothetical protein A2917_03765 [Candidatus Nomurabacteria bacterium RIFCSPLOWO2_01_FULL_42_17]